MRMRFAAAPWSGELQLTSVLGTMTLGVVMLLAYHGFLMETGVAHTIGRWTALLGIALLFGSLLFCVRGYAVEGRALHIERLLFSTLVPLSGLEGVWTDPDACKNSIRLFGNGGLYGYSGLFRSGRLGVYRVFGTNLRKSVVLKLPGRIVVVTPEAPADFIACVRHVFPGTSLDPSKKVPGSQSPDRQQEGLE